MSKTHKVDIDRDDKLRSFLLSAINKNCVDIPYEGLEIDKEGVINDFFSYLKENHYSILKHDK